MSENAKENINKEEVKQAIVGFAAFMRAITKNQYLQIPKYIAEKFGIDEESGEQK